MSPDRLRKSWAALIIVGVLVAQSWTIVPLRWEQFWYWPFMNYPMYSAARYAGDEFSSYELWAGPAGKPDDVRFITSQELHLTTFKYAKVLRMASNRDGSVVYGHDESASEFIARVVAQRMPGQPLRLQIWEHTWTIGPAGLADRAGVRGLQRDWTTSCGIGLAGAPCSGVP